MELIADGRVATARKMQGGENMREIHLVKQLDKYHVPTSDDVKQNDIDENIFDNDFVFALERIRILLDSQRRLADEINAYLPGAYEKKELNQAYTELDQALNRAILCEMALL